MLRGSIVALITPMQASGAIDEACLKDLVNWHIKQGTQGIVAGATTGEGSTLAEEEWEHVIRIVCDTVQKRVPVVAGTGSCATKKTIEATHKAKDLGADAALIVTPYYNRPTQEGLFQHFAAIAQAVDLPILLYNVPARTACDLLPKTIVRLAQEVPSVIGIKEATGDLHRLAELKERCPLDFLLLSGDDTTGVDFVLQGGHGVISVVANMVPQVYRHMMDAALEGDTARVHVLNERLAPWYRRLTLEANPIPIKWVMHRLGKIPEGIRLPLTPLSAVFHEMMIEALEQIEVDL